MKTYDNPVLNLVSLRVPAALAAVALTAAIAAGCSDGNDNNNNNGGNSVANTVPGTPTLPADRIGNYTAAAQKDLARSTPQTPWWCKGFNGDPDLSKDQCLDFSQKIDNAEYEARRYPTVADITAAGGVLISDRPANIGLAYTIGEIPKTFTEYSPNVYLYGGPTNGNRLVGVAWATASGGEPAGFAGERENWVADGSGRQWLMAWIIRGHENQPDVFATSQPCLTDTDTKLTSTHDACFVASHPEPFEVMVSNDDGYQAPGIDALVEGLYTLPNTEVHVVAPLANQSGAGDATTPAPYVTDGVPGTTLSGRPATAVSSTDPADAAGSGSPADSVIYGLNVLQYSPEVVVSGINFGQNIANLGSSSSGTIGAARTARRLGVPAIATSAGALTVTPDWPSAVSATLALLERWRLGLEVNTLESVLNINIPSCQSGETLNGTIYTVVATDLAGRSYTDQNCNSTVSPADIHDDVDAFNNGYISITDMGRDQPPNFSK
jgi:5'-nucleotidase